MLPMDDVFKWPWNRPVNRYRETTKENSLILTLLNPSTLYKRNTFQCSLKDVSVNTLQYTLVDITTVYCSKGRASHYFFKINIATQIFYIQEFTTAKARIHHSQGCVTWWNFCMKICASADYLINIIPRLCCIVRRSRQSGNRLTQQIWWQSGGSKYENKHILIIV